MPLDQFLSRFREHWFHFLHFAIVFNARYLRFASGGLDVNSKKVIRRARKGRAIRQVAAVPFRLTADGQVQVMLTTSRSTQRFIVPKGWRAKGKSGREAAGIEAAEEAGVSGRMVKAPIGRYRYWKRLAREFVPVEVTVYLLSVEEELADWDEADTRQRAWMSPADAATLIDEPELASLVGSLAVALPAPGAP
jgi:hypothetical protein